VIIEYYGDLLQSRRQTLTCTTNCEGAMGAGLALAFKQQHPASFEAYRALHRQGALQIDRLHVAPLGNGQQVLYFPTKDRWRDPSQLEWLENNLATLARDYRLLGIESLAIPPLGAGLGGLEYQAVHRLVYRHLKDHPLLVEFYVPY